MSRVVDTADTPSQQVLSWVDRYRWWLCVAIVLLYVGALTGQWRIGPDSAVHVAIARSLAAGGPFVHPTGRQSEVNPGLAYLMAGMFRLFGEPRGMVAAHVAMAGIGLLGLGLTYTLIRLHVDHRTAVLVTAILAITETYFRYCFYLLTDIPFTVGGLLALVGVELLVRPRRWWLGAACIAAGMLVMALFRTVFATFLAAMVVTLAWHGLMLRGPRRWWCAAGVAAALPAALFAWRMFGGESTDQKVLLDAMTAQLPGTLSHAVTSNIPKLIGEVITEALVGLDWGYGVGIPISVFILVSGVMLVRTRVLWGVLVMAFVLQWSLFLVTERYVMPILPLLVLAWWRGSVWLAGRLGRGWVLWLMLGLLVVSNLVKTGDFIAVEQRGTPFVSHYLKGRYEPWTRIAAWLRENTSRETIVVMDGTYAAEMVALSERVAVGPLADKKLFSFILGFLDRSQFAVLIEPIQNLDLQQLERRGWMVGEVLWTYEDVAGTRWTVKRVERSAKPQALQ